MIYIYIYTVFYHFLNHIYISQIFLLTFSKFVLKKKKKKKKNELDCSFAQTSCICSDFAGDGCAGQSSLPPIVLHLGSPPDSQQITGSIPPKSAPVYTIALVIVSKCWGTSAEGLCSRSRGAERACSPTPRPKASAASRSPTQRGAVHLPDQCRQPILSPPR